MSLGFLPIVLTMVLCLFIAQDYAVYIGTATGLLASLRTSFVKGVKVPRFILYLSTAILVVFTLATFIYCKYCPYGYLPLTLEMSTFITMAILYMHKSRFVNYFVKRQDSCSKHFYAQGAESAIVSARIFLIVAATHYAVVLLTLLFSSSFVKENPVLFHRYLPLLVFVLSILFNEIAIMYFNKITKHIEYVPIVTKEGHVVGRTMALEAINYKNKFINPVIRVAAYTQGKLYLAKRSMSCILDKGKVDVPMECYLRYNEQVEKGALRLVKSVFPKAKTHTPFFTTTYHYETAVTNRLIYLFIVEVEDPSLLINPNLKEAKLWSFEEIEKASKDQFCECFLQEYTHIKEVICTREKYKEF